MQTQLSNATRFLWSTLIGGVFFLLPLVALCYLLGQVYVVVASIAKPLHSVIPVNSPVGIAFLFSLAVAILLLVCFTAGFAASRAIGAQFSKRLETHLLTLFPKYAIYKDLLAGNLQHDSNGPSLQPVFVATSDGYRLAFESDRLESGQVVVYFAGAPDTWIGSIAIIEPERVLPCNIPFRDAVTIFERLGRDSKAMLGAITLPHSHALQHSSPVLLHCSKGEGGK